MSEKSGKAQRLIMNQIEGHEGDSTSAITWRYLGGGFKEGVAVGTVTINPAQLVFGLGIKARVSELSKLGKVVRRSRPKSYLKGATGDGYYPAGSSGRYRAVAPVASADPEVTVVSGLALAQQVADLQEDFL